MNTTRIEDITRDEFLQLVKDIFNVSKNRDTHDELIDRFEELSQHPDGSDLMFYPENQEDSTPERIVEIVEQWRDRNGLPGFRSAL
ncbi:bacteriocin immunity protein [Marinobacter xiaoshiensis]|uniref:Bacteriocin immunity protein n=1 Tax=Marinobacter xiaoshiensis TaxID=3073652 RepID=A0ABU2HFV8_9GAMM|nr:bacteriocin immunity protein [Marinobacter sp. F60267]MDS1309963.1 bacteriocin immunity protein [Marinobacter sp. F60267]